MMFFLATSIFINTIDYIKTYILAIYMGFYMNKVMANF